MVDKGIVLKVASNKQRLVIGQGALNIYCKH